jgi:hypothetical protein
MVCLLPKVGSTQELTRIIVPANGSAPSMVKNDHLPPGSGSQGSTTIWKEKNIIISMYRLSGLTYFDIIEINNQIGTPISKNLKRVSSNVTASSATDKGLNIVT